MNVTPKVRVLVVDDSAIVRKIISETLAEHPGIEVVGVAPDPYIARDKILTLEPDVLTLDIEMPRMDGLTFLRKLMHFRPMPVVVISSLAQHSCQSALEALRLGAVEVLAKPAGPYSVGELKETITGKVLAAAHSVHRQHPEPAPLPTPKQTLASLTAAGAVVAIGASTGGTEAIYHVLAAMPAECPPMLITQHIPAGFSRAFAQRLNQCCAMEVREAVDGDEVRPGLVLVAPGNFHMLLRRTGGAMRVVVKDGPRVCYQRPSVDVLFASVAQACGANTVAALLTGMGSDGAQGLLQIRRAGGFTLAQDEASCVVFGMPREAIRLEAATRVAPLNRMAHEIMQAVSGRAAELTRA